MDRPRSLFLAGIGASVAVALSSIGQAAHLVGAPPDPFLNRPPPSKRNYGKHGGRPSSFGAFKGSAEAKRATRRGGNPARSRYAKPPAAERRISLDFVKRVIG